MSPAPILIVEDDAEIAGLLQAGLTAEGYDVGTAPDGRDLIDKVASGGFSVVVLDRMLPDADGAELCQALRATGVGGMILMLTAKGSLDDELEGLRSGADDYMTKPFAFEELLARLEALLRRGSPDRRAPDDLAVADLRLDLRRKLAFRGDRELDLTATEFALLAFLARNPGRVVSRRELLTRSGATTSTPTPTSSRSTSPTCARSATGRASRRWSGTPEASATTSPPTMPRARREARGGERSGVPLRQAGRVAARCCKPFCNPAQKVLSVRRSGSTKRGPWVVPPARLERATPRSTIWCSNQLS